MTPVLFFCIFSEVDSPMPPPRKKEQNKETLYQRMPDSLKAECLVRTKTNLDEKVVRERQELVKNLSPAELSEISGFSDLPFPTLRKNKESSEKADSQSVKSKDKETLYQKLPESLKAECLVRTKVEEDEKVLKERQAMTRSMSPAELGQIRGISDIPFPSLRKKKNESEKSDKTSEKVKSKENLYEKLPDSLKTECLVRTKVEVDEKVLKERQEMTRSMSPVELSRIHGISDFPVPTLRKKKDKSKIEKTEDKKSKENLYERLPDSLKAECLVRTKVEEDEKVLKERQRLTRNMSPAELGQIRGFSDIPIPSFGKRNSEKKELSPQRDASIQSKETMYDRLPDSLKAECLVRTKVELDEKILKERQELTRAKSPAELSKIEGFSDIPIPTFRSKSRETPSKAVR